MINVAGGEKWKKKIENYKNKSSVNKKIKKKWEWEDWRYSREKKLLLSLVKNICEKNSNPYADAR